MVPTPKKCLLALAAIAAAIAALSSATPESAHARLFSVHRNKPGPAAPEVDPGTISSVIALALGGCAVLGDRLRRR